MKLPTILNYDSGEYFKRMEYLINTETQQNNPVHSLQVTQGIQFHKVNIFFF